jgi:hypothetical protein
MSLLILIVFMSWISEREKKKKEKRWCGGEKGGGGRTEVVCVAMEGHCGYSHIGSMHAAS